MDYITITLILQYKMTNTVTILFISPTATVCVLMGWVLGKPLGAALQLESGEFLKPESQIFHIM